MKFFLILISCIILAAVAGGCAQLVGGYKTSIRILNTGVESLSDVELTSASGFNHWFGYFSSGGSYIYGAPISASPQSIFTLSWTEEASGLKYDKRLDVPSLVTRTYGKTLVFEIKGGGNVNVFTEKYR